MSISIAQGDYVLYQDTSLGSPTSRAWNFPGGTPTGATATNPIVRYLSPSSAGFGAKLTITKESINTFKEETNIIIVTPENISVTLTSNVPAGTTIPMGTTVTYTAVGSTASLSYYDWTLAGVAGFTGTNSNQSTSILSWLNLTGSDSGATYSTYTSTSSVVFNSFLANTSASNTNVTYSKNGGYEPYNYLSDAYTIGEQYYLVQDTTLLSFSIGMPGSGSVYRVDTDNVSSLPINNTQFRAQCEILNYLSSSQDIAFIPDKFGLFPGQFVASASAFGTLGVIPTGWESLTRYTLGNYMIPGDLESYFSYEFYFADVLGYSVSLRNNRYWTASQISDLIFNDTSIAYQSSRALELYITSEFPVAYVAELDGDSGASGGYGGACLPSCAFTGTPTVELYLTVRFSDLGDINNIIFDYDDVVIVVVSDMEISGGQGNSPDGTLVFMQDNLAGPGVATQINDALIANGYGSHIVASASPDYAWASNLGIYDSEQFNGLKISIIDREYGFSKIVAVDLSDNGPWPPYPFYPGVPTTTGRTNWISFNTNRIANPYQLRNLGNPEPIRGWYFGGTP